MSFGDVFSQIIGVQPNERTNKHGATKEDMLRRAASDMAKASQEAFEAAKLGAGDAYDLTQEELAKAAAYSKEKAVEGAQYLGSKAYDAAGVVKDTVAESAARSGDYLAEKSGEAWEATKEKSGEAWEVTKEKSGEAWELTKEHSQLMAEKAAREAAHQFENSKELAADAAEYSGDKIMAGVRQVPDLTRSAYELAGSQLETFKDAAGNTWERVTDAAGDYYERMLQSASEYTDEAGNVYESYKDASGKEGRRLLHKASDKANDAYKQASRKADEANHEAHGLFHHVSDGIAHVGHSLGSIFHAKKQDAEELARDAYAATGRESDRLAYHGRQYAEEAASRVQSGYEDAKDAASAWLPSTARSMKDSLPDQKTWDKYFARNKKLDANEWKRYLQSSSINPQHWFEYMDAYQKGPRGLNAFWQKAEKKGYNAKNSVQRGYLSAKDGARRASRIGNGEDAATAPVSLFWTAVLALYLLVLAKRVFEQKRLLVSHEKDGRDTPASSAAEKMRLSDVARASNDSLSTFAIYAPATAVVLLTHELQNAANPYLLHGLYASLFVGQILQNEATYSSNPRARGAGIYLSWGAAGLAGAAGILTSLTGFHF